MPTAPPRERKNCTAEVAAPRSAWSTAFWEARVITGITEPTPRPVSRRTGTTSDHDVVVSILDSR